MEKYHKNVIKKRELFLGLVSDKSNNEGLR